jgi:hypothetical protein
MGAIVETRQENALAMWYQTVPFSRHSPPLRLMIMSDSISREANPHLRFTFLAGNTLAKLF